MADLEPTVRVETWPLAKPFIISRGTQTNIAVIVVEILDGHHRGRGECCPVEYFGQTVAGEQAAVLKILSQLRRVSDWDALHDQVPAGPARNAVDCAIWDLRAKRSGVGIGALFGLDPLKPVETVFTISLESPEAMAASALAATGHDILKLKFGAPGDVERIRAIRQAVPDKRLVVDVNEAWSRADLDAFLPAMAEAGVLMVEQPLKAGRDAELDGMARPIPLGADESCRTTADLDRVVGRYDVVNIKLDKTGGLTEAMRLSTAAREQGLDTMVGCMLGTSLAMAPAMLVAQTCRFVDLDAPLLIGADRAPSLGYLDGFVHPPIPALWG